MQSFDSLKTLATDSTVVCAALHCHDDLHWCGNLAEKFFDDFCHSKRSNVNFFQEKKTPSAIIISFLDAFGQTNAQIGVELAQCYLKSHQTHFFLFFENFLSFSELRIFLILKIFVKIHKFFFASNFWKIEKICMETGWWSMEHKLRSFREVLMK